MQAGKLNTKINIKRLVNSDNGFGGYTSVITDVASIWCDLKQLSGEIADKFGKRSLDLDVEVLVRKETADLIELGDVFTVENDSVTYRINEKFNFDLHFYTKLSATKSD